jgi:hypothetical protein
MRVPFNQLGATLLTLGDDLYRGEISSEVYNTAYSDFLTACGWTMAEFVQAVDENWDLSYTEVKNPKA